MQDQKRWDQDRQGICITCCSKRETCSLGVKFNTGFIAIYNAT